MWYTKLTRQTVKLFTGLFIAVLLVFASCMVDAENISVSGTIRSTSLDNWTVLNNSEHEPTNILSVKSFPGYVRINYTFTASKVHYLIATPDETFAGRGYIIGASVGLSYSNIYIYKYINGVVTLIDPQTIASSGGNIWIVGEFE